MNLPKTSSPTTAANATRRPSLAAPHAKIAARPSDDHLRVIDEPFRLPERRHYLVADQHEVRVGVTEHQDIEARHASAAYRAHRLVVVGRMTTMAACRASCSCRETSRRRDVDAIVNAANTSLRAGGGVDGAITRAAGPDALADRERVIRERGTRPLPTGDAVATIGGALLARWIIHTAGPVYSGSPDDARLLASCHTRSLEVADELGARTVAFPAISTGVYGYPLDEAAPVADRRGPFGGHRCRGGAIRAVRRRRVAAFDEAIR